MTKILFIALFVISTNIILFAQNNMDDLKQQLMQTDRDFSEMSKSIGMIKSFLFYADDNAVFLRKDHRPIEGIKNIKAYYSFPDTGFTVTWEPLFASASESGDMGYTYGIATYLSKDEKGNPETGYGTYVTIWRKQKDGSWKYVLDTGNPGLEPKK